MSERHLASERASTEHRLNAETERKEIPLLFPSLPLRRPRFPLFASSRSCDGCCRYRITTPLETTIHITLCGAIPRFMGGLNLRASHVAGDVTVQGGHFDFLHVLA